MSFWKTVRSLFGESSPKGDADSAAGSPDGSYAGSPAGPGSPATAPAQSDAGSRTAQQAAGSRMAPEAMGQGFLVFEQTGDVLAAERILRREGFAVEVKAPPASMRKGCDMVVVCPIMSHVRIQGLLARAGLMPLEFVPVSDPLLAPVSLFQVTDYGDWFMVRAANMKITIARKDGRIVNISGGGCPDVPYLAGLLLDRRLDDADEPRLHGRTLCSYALQRAFEEARRLWRG